nr:cell wall hydrolase [Paracoccus sp. MKU1]
MFHRHTELECMERAMYFEANRSSRDGLIAVGSVVMNRVQSNQFPNSVCGVVGQKGQFAPGIMTRRMDKAPPQVREAARAVLRGERHPLIGNAMFFHTAGHRFSYDNMHYVLVAGGNAFYEKRKNYLVTQPVPPRPIEGMTGR